MLRALVAAVLLTGLPTWSGARDINAILDQHVIPRYQTLVESTAALSDAAQADCTHDSAALRAAYHDAFDAWIGVSHLRFGPSEIDNRAFALAFWPDSRGATPKALSGLIRDADPVVEDPEGFKAVSVAARGFYALEFLLYDPAFADQGDAAYRCTLIQAVARDIAENSADILNDWDPDYAALLREAGSNDTYRSENEAAKQFFTALTTGLEFTGDMRIGRPLGTFDAPRPNRAEARRSERSLQNVVLSLDSTRELAALLSDNDPDLDATFARALDRAAGLEDDPVFASVTNPQDRIAVEVFQQSVSSIRQLLALELGPSLGIEAGFNALDGD
ncbi:MAG: imelysin family protein [Pseudomonadota bacterium]